MPKQKRAPRRTPRLFTRADVEAYFQEGWGKSADPQNELKSMYLLPELDPPTWLVSYMCTWRPGTATEHTAFYDLVIAQKDTEYKPYLNLVTQVELPEDLSTPSAEDAEIARLQAEKAAERRKRWEAQH